MMSNIVLGVVICALTFVGMGEAESSSASLYKFNLKESMKELCGNFVGGQRAYAAIEKAMEDMNDVFNIGQFVYQLEQTEPVELGTLFQRYCPNRATERLSNFTQLLEPCLDFDEEEIVKGMQKVFLNLFNFACSKGSDQVALFETKGEKCINQKQNQFHECFAETFGKYVQSEGGPLKRKQVLTNLAAFVNHIGAEECNEISSFQSCYVGHLRRCDSQGAADFVESWFKFTRNDTGCNTMVPENAKAHISANILRAA